MHFDFLSEMGGRSEGLVDMWCGERLSAGSVAAEGLYHHGYLIFLASLKGTTRAIFCSINASLIFSVC